MSTNKIPVTFMDTGENQFLTAYVGNEPFVAREDHINFARLCERLVPPAAGATMDDADEIRNLFDPAIQVEQKFQRLSERITFEHGVVKLDGDVADQEAPLIQQILRFVEEGIEDWQPLVLFFEKLLTNPDEHSQSMLYKWVRAQNVSITPEGDMICYKGVYPASDQGDERFPVDEYPYQAGSSGFAIVDDKEFNGYTPNRVGATVRMPRHRVTHAPHLSCHSGLHIGSYDYAGDYGSVRLAVIVNPRDVVSVPNDGAGEKARVCRYVVAEIAEEAPYPTAIHSFDPEFDEFEKELLSFEAGYSTEEPEIKVEIILDGLDDEVLDALNNHGQDETAPYVDLDLDEIGYGGEDDEYLAALKEDLAAGLLRSENEVLKAMVGYWNPSEDEFDTMVARAHRRRRNFVKYATKHGPWTLMENDGSKCADWAVDQD